MSTLSASWVARTRFVNNCLFVIRPAQTPWLGLTNCDRCLFLIMVRTPFGSHGVSV
jgi:hypothetical protein